MKIILIETLKQWENHSHRIVFALGKTKGNKVAPCAEKYRKVIGGIGGFTRDPDYATWERFPQEVIKRYIGIEEDRRALDEMDRISYKGKISVRYRAGRGRFSLTRPRPYTGPGGVCIG